MSLPVVHHPDYHPETPVDERRFPMDKYAHLARRLRDPRFSGRLEWKSPAPVTREQLLRAHDEAYVDAVLSLSLDARSVRRIGLPLTESIVRRALTSCGGTILTAHLALERGLSVNLAGGSHHAARAQGAGFCLFNDVAVAALDLLASGAARRILVLDCDVHQGDGTALIFADDPRVFTVSIHCRANWPLEKPPSDLDVELEPGSGDEVYLSALEEALEQTLPQARPDLVIFNAGVDPHIEDRLGRLSLSDQGLRKRENLVLETCARNSLPLAAVLGGGYGPDPDAIAQRHLIVFETFSRISSPGATPAHG
ncbi:MAG: histone deacetylase [Alphaproteobacteria bacterium]|nr:histone deacetylase [Alphaproteobacteria bacterium]